ncbi:MAG: hypothetical protein ABI625_15275 [bacterium]
MSNQPRDQSDTDTSAVQATQPAEALYTRPMPGGGCVRIELLVSEPGNLAAERRRGRVVMERGSNPRSETVEAEQLVVEEIEGDSEDTVVAELFRIACDNAAIARRVLRRNAPRARRD